LVKKNYATVKLDSNGFSWNENVKENAGKVNSVFVIRAALWGEKLVRMNVSLNIAGVQIIIMLGKHVLAVTTGRHLISSFE